MPWAYVYMGMKKYRLRIETSITEYDDEDPTGAEKVLPQPQWSCTGSFNSKAEALRHAEHACKSNPPPIAKRKKR